MGELAAVRWVLENWKLVLGGAILAVLLGALGVQSYRLQVVTGERNTLAEYKKGRENQDALIAKARQANKERTDADYSAARLRAHAQRVLAQSAGAVNATKPVVVAASGDETSACFDRGKLNEELAGFAERTAARLNQVIAGVSRRNAGRLSDIAQQSEEVGAAFRACRAYTLNLVKDAPGRDEGDHGVGGIAFVPSLPVPLSYFAAEGR